MNNFSKNEIYKHYKKSNFPQEKISKDAIEYKDYLFSNNLNNDFFDESMNRDLITNKKNNLSESFYDLDESMNDNIKNYNNKKFNNSNPYWRKKNQEKETFEQNYNNYNKDYKKENKYLKIHKFIPSHEVSCENSFTINSFLNNEKNFNNKKNSDNEEGIYDPNDSLNENFFTKNKNNKLKKRNKDGFIFTDDIKEDIDKEHENIKKIDDAKKEIIEVEAIEIKDINLKNFTQQNFTAKEDFSSTINFKKINEINNQLRYPNNKPLWYIFHNETNSSFGPLSTNQLENLFFEKAIDSSTKIRFIDLIKFKNKGNFEYVELKDLESNDIIFEIEMTGLYKNLSNELSSLKKYEENQLINKNINIASTLLKKNKVVDKKDNKINQKPKPAPKPVKVMEVNALGLAQFNKEIFELTKEEEDLLLKTKNKNLEKIKKEIPEEINDSNLIYLSKQLEKDFKLYDKKNDKISSENIGNKKTEVKSNLDIKVEEKNLYYNNFGSKDLKKENENLSNKLNLIQNKELVIEIEEKQNQLEINNVMVGKKNKKKGKPTKVNVDVKTGFFTLTEHEKTYDPIYICGDHK